MLGIVRSNASETSILSGAWNWERVELPSFRKEVCEADIMKVVENAEQK